MPVLRKISALIALIRPELPLAAGVCVVVGQAVALGRFPPLPILGLGFALGLFLSSSAMVFNDLFDLAVDRINAPHRPIPSGQVAPGEAVAFGLFTGVAALGIALAIHPLAFGLSLAAWVLGFLYNWKLKSAGLWGNLIVSANVAMTFLMGGVSVGQAASPMLWIFGAIGFCFDLAEEIAGDAMDMAGDRERDSRSIAILWGKPAALRISAVLFGLVVLLTLAPAFLGETGLGYWIPIAVMDGIIAFFTVKLLQSQTPQEGRACMRAMYLSASLGLVAFVFGRFGG